MKIIDLIDMLNENTFQRVTTLSFQTSTGARVKINNNATVSVEEGGSYTEYRNCLFVSPEYGARLNQLDDMFRHFGGLSKLSIAFKQDSFYFIINDTGKAVAGQTQNGQEVWSFKFSKKPANNSIACVYSTHGNSIGMFDVLGNVTKILSN